jgi:protein tyrosine phosphatase (PTP) superfamily phosphohydrolase (DUF442 family)
VSGTSGETVSDQRKPSRLRRRSRRVLLALGLILFLASFHRFLFLNNFAVVERGRLYRSAQPKGDLDQTIRDLGLNAVLNLRGGGPNDWWFAAERAATEEAGIAYYDLPLSATRRPTRAELLALIDALETGPYPLLVHCKSGSDRTGLAAALYRLVVRGEPPERALTSFSLWRGHVPWLGPEHLHEPLIEYQAFLLRRGEAHTPARFRDWLTTHFEPEGRAGPAFRARPTAQARRETTAHQSGISR